MNNDDAQSLHASGAFYNHYAQKHPNKTAPVTVIIPHRNHSKYLTRCLTALAINQSMPPERIVVIDDFSREEESDAALSIVNALTKQAADKGVALYFMHNEDMYGNRVRRGVPNTMNHGLTLVSSRYVYFAACDDIVMPNFFEEMFAALASKDGTHMIYSRSWYEQYGVRYLAPKNSIPPNTCIYNIEFIRKHPFNPSLGFTCDWLVNHIAKEYYITTRVDKPLAVFYINENSYGERSAKNPIVYENLLAAMTMWPRLYKYSFELGGRFLGCMEKYQPENVTFKLKCKTMWRDILVGIKNHYIKLRRLWNSTTYTKLDT